MDYSYLILAGVVINRLVEVFKQALPETQAVERWRTVILLIASFVLGSLTVIFVLPTYNVFPDAASPLAGQIFTGILVGGAANGYDWLGSVVQQAGSKPVTLEPIKLVEGKPANYEQAAG